MNQGVLFAPEEFRVEYRGISPLADSMLPPTSWRPPTSFPDLSGADVVSIDIEARDPDLRRSGPGFVRREAEVIGVAVATGDGFSGYYPVRHEGGGNLAPNVVFGWLRDVLRTPVPKLGANLLYDLEGLWFEDVKVQGDCVDIQHAEALLEEEKDKEEDGYSLDHLARKYLGSRKYEDELRRVQEVLKIKDIKGELYRLPAARVGAYAEMDARLPIEIWRKQKPLLESQNLTSVFKLETDLIPLLLAMRIRGVRVDVDKAEAVSKELAREVAAKKREIKRLAGVEIDIWSNQDLARVCGSLGLGHLTTPKGNPSFTSEWLARHQHPAMQLVAEARKIEKMKRDFVEGFVLGMNHAGRLHTQFHPLRRDEEGTRSGRFSSSNPNLQQIPARDKRFGPLIRGLFIPEDGCRWGCFDYSSQEPRLTVHYAYLAKLAGADEARRKYCDDPSTDYHQMVADMAGIARKAAKFINLGLAYGMGKRKLSVQLGYLTPEQAEDRTTPIPPEAEEVFRKYHEAVPYVQGLNDMCANLAQTRGYIITLLGRRRHFELYEPRKFRSEDADGKKKAYVLAKARKIWGDATPLQRAFTHKALNSLIQGSAADMTKKAMLDLWRAGYVPHLTVHDEVDDSITSDRQFEEMRRIMVDAVTLTVPVKIDAELVANWGEAS